MGYKKTIGAVALCSSTPFCTSGPFDRTLADKVLTLGCPPTINVIVLSGIETKLTNTKQIPQFTAQIFVLSKPPSVRSSAAVTAIQHRLLAFTSLSQSRSTNLEGAQPLLRIII